MNPSCPLCCTRKHHHTRRVWCKHYAVTGFIVSWTKIISLFLFFFFTQVRVGLKQVYSFRWKTQSSRNVWRNNSQATCNMMYRGSFHCLARDMKVTCTQQDHMFAVPVAAVWAFVHFALNGRLEKRLKCWSSIGEYFDPLTSLFLFRSPRMAWPSNNELKKKDPPSYAVLQVDANSP